MVVLPSMSGAATCAISATGVALGSYKPNQVAPADSAGTIRVDCTKTAGDVLPMNISYSIDISKGAGPAYTSREMSSGTNALRYNLYRDASRLNIWGDSSGGTSNVAGAVQLQPNPSTATATHTVYARIFASQNAVPGAYSDSIIVTISY